MSECPSERTRLFDAVIRSYMDKFFPWKKHKVKDTDDPWITDSIRTFMRRRKAAFKLYGRAAEWKRLKNITDELIAKKKQDYYKCETDKLTQNGVHLIAFKAI